MKPLDRFLGTRAGNIVDMQTKGRHAHGAGLSDDQVRTIRAHGGTLDNIAAEFGIHRNYVSMLRSGQYRKDLS